MNKNTNNLNDYTSADVIKRLKELRDGDYAKHHQAYFKTKDGEYGEGDIFLGLRVPEQRRVAETFKNIPLSEIRILLESPYHECRFTALIILIKHFEKGNESQKSVAVELYLNSTKYINNWDLVDVSAPKILGPWLLNRDRAILYTLADSDSIWEQRISILTTLHFIKKGDFKDCIDISEKLLYHNHDLIHKAVGWLLREVGKKDKLLLDNFLNKHYQTMPRTMLRYAIEKHPEKERKAYLKKQ